jgi:hypothetical protein
MMYKVKCHYSFKKGVSFRIGIGDIKMIDQQLLVYEIRKRCTTSWYILTISKIVFNNSNIKKTRVC